MLIAQSSKMAIRPYVLTSWLSYARKSDNLEELQAKMREYIDNGARLGWLINPLERTVEIYRPSSEALVLHSPTNLSGSDVLPGFVLDTLRIFA